MKKKKIAVLGCGIMGSILLEILSKIDGSFSVYAFDNNPQKVRETKKKFKKTKTSSDISLVNSCDVIFLAVKPQDFKNFSFKLAKNALVISIMAGVSTKTIEKKLEIKKVVRAMPNMPARIKMGITGWTATKSVSRAEKIFTKKVFSGMGEEVYVKGDEMIDKITAVSGSGPAYVFYMISCFIDSALALGIKKEDAKKFVFSTVKGGVEMINEKTDLSLLVKNVASKGGTTEAALKQFNDSNVPEIWKKAILSAYKRAKELSRKI